MGVKIYNKRGSKNYKEKRMIDEIQSIVDSEVAKNPDLDWTPATNFDELQTLYNRYSAEITDVESVDIPEGEDKENSESQEDNSLFNEDTDFQEEGSDFVDPFNRENPIVRDYVTGTDAMSEEKIEENRPLNSFNEPLSFQEAFEIPDGNASEETTSTSSSSEKKTKTEKDEAPVNPDFDTMSGGKKRRSTKKFAKYIVETVCMLSEKGFVWYANSEISENKLTEYEATGEIDLSLLVSLEDGQEVTCKQFFQVQCAKAEQLCKIDEQEKADLAEALAEVLMEKGIGPTPTQELILISLKIFGSQAITLMALKSQTNSLLNQLRSMNEEGGARPTESAPTPTPQATTSSVADPEEWVDAPAQTPPPKAPPPAPTVAELEESIAQPQEEGLIEKTLETKE